MVFFEHPRPKNRGQKEDRGSSNPGGFLEEASFEQSMARIAG